MEDWRSKMTIRYKYRNHRDAFLQLLSEVDDMGDGHLGRVKTAKHRIDMISKYIRLFHSTPYHAGPKTRQSTAEKIEKLL